VQVLRIDDIADTPSANDGEAKLELLPCSAVVKKNKHITIDNGTGARVFFITSAIQKLMYLTQNAHTSILSHFVAQHCS